MEFAATALGLFYLSIGRLRLLGCLRLTGCIALRLTLTPWFSFVASATAIALPAAISVASTGRFGLVFGHFAKAFGQLFLAHFRP